MINVLHSKDGIMDIPPEQCGESKKGVLISQHLEFILYVCVCMCTFVPIFLISGV